MADTVTRADNSDISTRLKELLKEISAYIDDASEDQKKRLLGSLEKSLPIDRRRHPRKQCSIGVTCATYRVFADFIKDISPGGVFIETSTPCLLGEHITMSFSLPNREEAINATGKIVRTAKDGVGVRFTAANKELEGIIASL